VENLGERGRNFAQRGKNLGQEVKKLVQEGRNPSSSRKNVRQDGIMQLMEVGQGKDAALRRPRPAGRNERGKSSFSVA
jgi:hypothetical protein